MEIVTSWMEKGMEKGMQKEATKLVLRQLNRRLGGVDTLLMEQLEQLSIERLEDLGEALLDFEREADLLDWLNRETVTKV